jgi:hypothetical protein
MAYKTTYVMMRHGRIPNGILGHVDGASVPRVEELVDTPLTLIVHTAAGGTAIVRQKH